MSIDSTNVPTIPPSKTPAAMLRTGAWAVTAVQFVFTVAAAISLFPLAASTLQSIGGGGLLVALFFNVAGFRPERGSQHVDGPLPSFQRPRTFHALASIGAFIILIVVTGGPLAR